MTTQNIAIGSHRPRRTGWVPELPDPVSHLAGSHWVLKTHWIQPHGMIDWSAVVKPNTWPESRVSAISRGTAVLTQAVRVKHDCAGLQVSGVILQTLFRELGLRPSSLTEFDLGLWISCDVG